VAQLFRVSRLCGMNGEVGRFFAISRHILSFSAPPLLAEFADRCLFATC
jgi:hypothetical protein